MSVPRLVIFHYDPKSKRLVINKCVKLVVEEIRAELQLRLEVRTRVDVT